MSFVAVLELTPLSAQRSQVHRKSNAGDLLHLACFAPDQTHVAGLRDQPPPDLSSHNINTLIWYLTELTCYSLLHCLVVEACKLCERRNTSSPEEAAGYLPVRRRLFRCRDVSSCLIFLRLCDPHVLETRRINNRYFELQLPLHHIRPFQLGDT